MKMLESLKGLASNVTAFTIWFNSLFSSFAEFLQPFKNINNKDEIIYFIPVFVKLLVTCIYVSQNHTYTTNRREICITSVILFIQIYTINCIRKMFIMPGNHSQDFKKSLNCP